MVCYGIFCSGQILAFVHSIGQYRDLSTEKGSNALLQLIIHSTDRLHPVYTGNAVSLCAASKRPQTLQNGFIPILSSWKPQNGGFDGREN